MENKNIIDLDYKKTIDENLHKKFVLYLRTHPSDPKELELMNDLAIKYGEYKELHEERLAIFILYGNMIDEFVDKLNSFQTQMYLSYIQSEDELIKK